MSSVLRSLARRNAVNRLDRSLPFFNVDWVFEKYPGFAKDKVRYMTTLLQTSFAAGVAFVFLFINPPFGCSDYENVHKSMLYKLNHYNLEKSGQLYENQRIKRDYFYSPGSPVDPAVKIPEPHHDEE
jgi:hypothetical protein